MHWSLAAAAGCFSISHVMSDLEPFELAESVADTARSLGIETALIGAGALAIYGYVRGTSDLDLATFVNPLTELPRLRDALADKGLRTRLNLPDAEDSVGGVLRVWSREDGDGDPIEPVEIVNFLNPHRPLPLPVHEFLHDSVELSEMPALRYVRLPHLVLLKMYAGSRQDLADVVALLARNRDADMEEIRAACKRYGFDSIDELIAEAQR
jgi:hypothetical protein